MSTRVWMAAVILGTGAALFAGDIDITFSKRFELKDQRGRMLPDGKALIVERSDGTGQIQVIDGVTGKVMHAFEEELRAIEVSPDGKLLTTQLTEFRSPKKPPRGQKEFTGEARYYNDMLVWDLARPEVPRIRIVIAEGSRPVFSPDGRWLLVYCLHQDQPPRWDVWAVENGKRILTFPVVKGGVHGPVFSPNGDMVVFPGPEELKVYELPSGTELRTIAHQTSPPIGDSQCVLFPRGNANARIVFSPDSKTLATAGDDGKVRLWNVATGALTATLAEHILPHTYVQFSPDGKRLLTGSVGVTDVDRVVPGFKGKGGATAKATVVDPAAGEVIVWDSASLQKLRTLPIRCPVSLDWSSDGKLLAVGDQSKSASGKPNAVQLWNISDGRLVQTLDSFDEARFAADGKTLMSSNASSVRIWTRSP